MKLVQFALVALFVTACSDDGSSASGSASAGGTGGAAAGAAGSGGDPSGSNGGDGGSGASPSTPLTADAFRATLPALLCDKISACCNAPPSSSCEDDVTAKLDAMFAALTDRVVFEPNEAAGCIEALKAIPEGCPALIEASAIYRPACSAILNGTVEPGGVCAGVEECRRAPGAQGNTQTGFNGCAVLGGSGDERRCRRFRPMGDLGDGCERGFDGTDAEVNLCVPELSCNRENQCQTKPTLGQPCPLNDCVDSVCDGGTCVEGAPAGASCLEDRCALGLECTPDSVCAERLPSQIYVGICPGGQCIDSVCPSE